MYAVQCFNGSNTYYTDTLEEAEKAYFDMCNGSEFVQILSGQPGAWEVVRTSF